MNGQNIPEQALHSLISRHLATINARHVAEGKTLSHFEVLTALAYKYFEEEDVDVAVIETGLGGARDATNVLPPSCLLGSVITPIGLDHAAALGEINI